MAITRFKDARFTQGLEKETNFWDQSSTPYVTDNLQLFLDAKETSSYSGSGTTWYDLSSNSYSGTLTNSPTWNSAGYFTFDGTNDYVEFGDILDPGTNNWSISTLVYPLANAPSTNNTFIVSKALAGASNYRYATSLKTDTTKLRAFIEPSDGFPIVVESSSVELGVNSWSFFTSVFNKSGNLSLYKNDTLVASTSMSVASGDTFNSNHPFRVGCYTNADNTTPSFFYNGRISLVSVHFKALSESEVIQNFNCVRERYNI
jgi:hypothetical protein